MQLIWRVPSQWDKLHVSAALPFGPGGPRGLKFLRKLRHLALDDIPRGLGREMPKNIFHCSSYTSLSHIDLCVGRAFAAATFSVPDWLRKHLGPRNSGTRIGGPWRSPVMNFGSLRPSWPLRFRRPYSQLIQWKLHRWFSVKGVLFGQSGRCGHGTPDSVPGDRDVTYMSISGDQTFLSARSDLLLPAVQETLMKTNGISYTRLWPRIGPWVS